VGGMTQLRTLGGLSLNSLSFTRPKPLVLLAYLALECTQQRKHLAELFWQDGNRMKSLSMAFTLLRQGAGDVVDVDAKQAKLKIPSDVSDLLKALDKSDWESAINLYTGAFLEGVVLEDWSSELEEWVYQTREYLAERVQYALLNLAEDSAKQQDFETTTHFAERAYKLPGLGATEVTHLKRLYTLLCSGNSLLAPEVRKEAESYGIALQLTTEEARTLFKAEKPLKTMLPMRGTSFVGRDIELTELASLIHKPKVSLVTLLGPAGVGKTRLALQLAHEQQKLETFDEVYFVPLEALIGSSQIPATLLSHFGLQQGKTNILKQIADFLGERHLLLILDNFEHLIEGATFLSQLLIQCSNLTILATSRETLKLEEEHLFKLDGLTFPETLVDEKMFSDAVQLFKERAQQVKPQFDLESNLTKVIRICQLVEGLPLGVELAASWVRLMSCQEIVTEIDQGLELLSTTAQNVPERHHSLKAAFEYSWQLLNPKEQEVLRKLSVFRGGFRREAASEVSKATIPILASLVDKSLIRVTATGRYDFHPLLQQFAHEKFVQSNDKVEKDHAHYFSKLLQRKKNDISRAHQNEFTDSLAEELGNLEEMWDYLCKYQWVDDIANLATIMFLLHFNLGRLSEGTRLSVKARAALNKNNPEHYFALGSLCVREAGYLKYLALFKDSVSLAEEGLKYLQQSTHPDVWSKRVTGFNEAGVSLYHLGQFQQAMDYYQQAIDLAKTHKDLRSMKVFESNQANLWWHLGENEKAHSIQTQLVLYYKRLESWEFVIGSLCNLATIEWSIQNYDAARTLLEEAHLLYHQKNIRSLSTLCELLGGLGIIYGCLEDVEKAKQFHTQAVSLAKETSSPLYESSASLDFAYTLTNLGDTAKAEKHLKQSITILWAGSDRGRLLMAIIGWAKNELVKGFPEKAVPLLSLILTQIELAPKDQKAAHDVLDSARIKLSKRKMEQLLEEGKKLSLEQVVTNILNTSQKEAMSPLLMAIES
jgi:predicted ATPase